MDVDPLSLVWCELIVAATAWGAAGYLVLGKALHYTPGDHHDRMDADGLADLLDEADDLARIAYWAVLTTSLIFMYLVWPMAIVAIARMRRNRNRSDQ